MMCCVQGKAVFSRNWRRCWLRLSTSRCPPEAVTQNDVSYHNRKVLLVFARDAGGTSHKVSMNPE